MSDYPLTELGATFTEYKDKRLGMLIPCPNCGVKGGVYFNPVPEEFAGKPGWDATGDSLENITLTPSVKMFGHFHSWVKNGKLCVDSNFECAKES